MRAGLFVQNMQLFGHTGNIDTSIVGLSDMNFCVGLFFFFIIVLVLDPSSGKAVHTRAIPRYILRSMRISYMTPALFYQLIGLDALGVRFFPSSYFHYNPSNAPIAYAIRQCRAGLRS